MLFWRVRHTIRHTSRVMKTVKAHYSMGSDRSGLIRQRYEGGADKVMKLFGV